MNGEEVGRREVSRFEKDFIGRLLAIAGLLIVLIAASAFSDIYVAIFGFALFMTGRVIIFRAACG